MAERDQNEGSGQQQPIGQNDDSFDGQNRQQQPEGQSAQQEMDKADRQQQDQQSGDGSSGFVGSQDQDSGEYLQQGGNPESGFAEQGQGASEQSDIERGTERSENRESDIEGSSDDI